MKRRRRIGGSLRAPLARRVRVDLNAALKRWMRQRCVHLFVKGARLTVANPCIRIIRADMMITSPCCSMDKAKYFFENRAKIKSINETPKKIVLQVNVSTTAFFGMHVTVPDHLDHLVIP
jgi:hypothetical protein